MSEHTILTLAGADIEVVDVDGLEQMSQLYRIAVRGRVRTGVVRPKDVAGADAKLVLFDGFQFTRTINAIVERARTMYHDDGSVWLDAELRPAAWLLTRGRNCRSFQEKTVVEIVTEVLGGTPHRWETSFGYPVRAYTVQYRQDDWGFICRLLEQEGIHYWFDHDEGSVLVLGDDSTDAPDLVGGARIDVHEKTGMLRSEEVIEELGAIAAVVPTAFSVKSYSPKNPALDVSATSGAGALEFYDAPGGGPTLPAEAARSATIMHKAATAASATVRATTTSARLYPGRVVAPAGHPTLDGRYVVTHIRYEVRQRRKNGSEVERPWICHFEALDAATPFVAPRETPPSRQAGIQSGKVVGAVGEEIFPNEDGEVRVEQHWDRTGSGDDNGGTWMRVAQRGAHESMQLPRVGWNVLSFNDEGSVDAPSVLSRVNDGEHLPAYKLPDNKTRVVFKTATSPADGTFNEIYFEDKKGAEEMYFCASRDMNILVQRVKNEGVGCDSTRKIGNDRDLTVADDYEEAIDGDQTVNIGGDFIVDVSGACSLNVGGDLTENIGGDRTIQVGDAYEDAVKGDRTVTVGAAIIEMSKGSISGSGDHVKFEVGGPQLKMSQLSVADAHGGISMQKIAGSRIEFTKEDRGLDVEKLLLETIGGAFVIKTDKTYTDASEKTSKWTIAAALKSSTTEMIVTAQDKIELVCGNSSVTLLPGSVEIKADALDLSKSEVFEAEAPLVENNC